MKVYRGFDKSVGPISYTHWTYVTESKEQAKWYATKDGSVEDGAIIEYDMDKDHMYWITLSKINSFAENDNERYTEEDLLWYQEELAYSMYKYVDGIVFQDPYSKKPHTIYIILKEECLKNGRVLSKEEFDSIQLNESYYINEVNEVLKLAGVQLNEREDLDETILDAKSVGDELMNIILKNPTRKELRDNDMNVCRGVMGRSGNFYFISLSQLIHYNLFNTLEQMGINDAPYNVFRYSNKTNTFYYYDPNDDLDFNLIKKELEASPYFKNFTGCKFDTFDDPEFDPELDESVGSNYF
jgi:hypothetical protein